MKTSRLAVTANPCGATHPCASASTHPAQPGRTLSHFAAVLFLALIGQIATAGSVNLAWNPNSEPDIAFYKLSYGSSPGIYSNTLATGTTPSAAVSGLIDGQTYYFMVKAVNTAGLESAPSTEISYQVPVPSVPPIIPLSDWRVVFVSSQETNGENGAAINAFDGNPATFWHSKWVNPAAPPPHEIQIDLGSTQSIQGFQYLPRQDGLLNGTIAQYEFYVSLDGISWGAAAASGTFAATSSMKEVTFTSRNARYIRLRGLSDASGGGFGCIAELDILSGDPAIIIPPPEPVNQAPVAAGQSLNTNEDQTIAITLAASDADGNPLTYRIVSSPTMGSLSGTAPNLTYTPRADANGSDSFTFVANDGKADSNTATVFITVVPANDAPTANAQIASALEDKPLGILLSASDKDGDALTYRIVTGPTKGSLSGSAPNLTYIPNPNAIGPDSFSFRANDGRADSNVASVSITISAVNDAPVAAAQVIAATAGAPVGIALSANDVDGDPLTFSIVLGPTQGSLSGSAPNLTYIPNANASGADSVSFQASDGKASSNIALVSINITPAEKIENKAPVFQADLISRASGNLNTTYIADSLAGSAIDLDGDLIAYSKIAGPSWLIVSPDGKISGTPPAGAEGLNSFTIRAADPDGAFDEAVLEITIVATELPLPWSLGRIGAMPEQAVAWGEAAALTIKSPGTLATSADSGVFTWQMLSGDGEIITKISGLENANSTSRIGLEIRDSLAQSAKHVFIGADGSGTLRFIRRAKTGGTPSLSNVGVGMPPNLWLRLVRTDFTISAYSSVNGSTWKRIGRTTVALGTSSYIGLMVSGGSDNLSTGFFQNVTVKP